MTINKIVIEFVNEPEQEKITNDIVMTKEEKRILCKHTKIIWNNGDEICIVRDVHYDDCSGCPYQIIASPKSTLPVKVCPAIMIQ